MGWLVLGFIALVAALVAARSTPAGKGRAGEKRVAGVLTRLDSGSYRVVNDLLLPASRGGSSQIDHVVVSVYGIFVLETKNYAGWIFGDEGHDEWTQVIYKKKSRFRNPVRQNWSHIHALRERLKEFPRVPFFPIVVFAGNAELRDVRASSPVVRLSGLRSTIERMSAAECLSMDDVERICAVLRSQNRTERSERREHVTHIQNEQSQAKEKRERLVCPKCNSALVVRKGPHGEFYGCSSYPRCKFTLPKGK